jgi:hypothetical protein
MLKIVLLGYSRGLISSRRIEAARLHNVQFIALTQWRLYCLVHNIEKLAGCGLRK